MSYQLMVVTQCSGCDCPICDGDRFVRTPYGDFCENCYKIETAEYQDTIPWEEEEE